MFELIHKIGFSAAHKLESPHLTPEENQRLYGPCHNLHGHNYELEVVVRGEVDPRTGMVMDLNVLAGLMHEHIFADVDHKDLGHDVPWLAGRITTAEVVAAAIWERLEAPLEGRLHRVRLYESAVNFVDYHGPTAS